MVRCIGAKLGWVWLATHDEKPHRTSVSIMNCHLWAARPMPFSGDMVEVWYGQLFGLRCLLDWFCVLGSSFVHPSSQPSQGWWYGIKESGIKLIHENHTICICMWNILRWILKIQDRGTWWILWKPEWGEKGDVSGVKREMWVGMAEGVKEGEAPRSNKAGQEGKLPGFAWVCRRLGPLSALDPH